MQLASRVHRSRRHKRGPGSKRLRAGAGSGSESGSSSLTSGTSTDPSTSEMSCDTVVYRHAPSSDSGTEGEGPPPASLRSSRESLSSRSSVSRRRILTNGAISRQSSPLSPGPGLASIAERMPLHGRVPGHRQQRTEVWVDSRPPPQAEASRAAMVSRWVENQSLQDQEAEVEAKAEAKAEAKTEAKPLFMTQFKTADSDSGSEGVARKVAPPPPPRRTPPRAQRPQSPEPLQEPGLEVREAAEASRVSESKEASRVPESGQRVEAGADLRPELEAEEASLHPLRVLSEENLTVVSTFVADVGDLEAAEDEQLDPSQFSFFSVPDFANNNGASGDYFQARLRALARIGEDTVNGNVEAVEAAPAPGGDEDTKDGVTAPASSFSDPRFLYGSYREMATFSAEARAEDTEAMTPQKQFLLLSQSLRTPDGSSDPDLASRLEDRDNGNCDDNDDVENDNDAVENDTDHAPIENDVPKPKLTFAARLLRLFGSRRHKTQPRPGERSQSWDRELGAGGQEPAQARRLHKEARCASSSPGKQRQARRMKRKEKEKGDTVSCLSLAPTEWEFSEARRQPPQQQADRKSSGYDSLDSPEGESSSLDSSSEPVYPAPAYAVPHQPASSLHYDEVTQLKMEIRRHPSILR